MLQLLCANAQAGLDITMSKKVCTLHPSGGVTAGSGGSVEPPLTQNFIFMGICGRYFDQIELSWIRPAPEDVFSLGVDHISLIERPHSPMFILVGFNKGRASYSLENKRKIERSLL